MEKLKKIHFSYFKRLVLSGLSFALLLSLGLTFLYKSLEIEEAQMIKYNETGSIDYKVYLKPNQFYETDYLGKGMYYIASLIRNIYVDLDYKFVIGVPTDMTFDYDIVGKLVISDDSGKNKLFEKEYTLKTKVIETLKNKSIYHIKDNLTIDYDYYNNLANSFKSTYGVVGESKLQIYIRVNKNVTNEEQNVNVKGQKQMTVEIPLTQKTLDVKINDKGINSSDEIVKDSHVSVGNVVYGVLFIISFILFVASVLWFLELLFMIKPKRNKYDKFVKKIITEYDRLIVETETKPRLENKEIIKIRKFEELLDARDNLKRPIMYHTVTKHQKCYFYIEKDNTIYLLIIKAVDLEG